MSKFTPGPWTTDDIDQSDFYRYVVGENKIVCRVKLKNFMGNKREHAEADARLIAAAPDLLAMLVEAHDIIDAIGQPETAEVAGRLRAVIAKAKGES